MGENFIYVVYATMVLLTAVLGVGLWTMLKGGNNAKSQNMMRWRLGVQGFLLVLVIVSVFYFGN